jgi:ABC-type nickel/cobalt efflux system permease component RcnA
VFILGFATLYASRFIVPERLFPILTLTSALLVLGMGVVLLVQRTRAASLTRTSSDVGHTIGFVPLKGVTGAPHSRHGLLLARNYFYPHDHGDGRLRHLGDPTLHSHGDGPLHSHLPPGTAGERVTWKNLATLGISGGLVPCPSAMVLLLAAIALNKTAYGMLLVLVFSAGLALTLTAVGLAFLHARNRFSRRASTARWTRQLPVLSAVIITLVGMALLVTALKALI